MSLLKTNEIQNYNGSSLTLTASTVSTSSQLNTGGNISVTGSLNVSDDSTTRTNLGLGTIATQDSDSITVTGGTATLGALTVSGSDSGDLVRITQTGSGNALVVEDSANPDSTPFVVDASGNCGIGTSSPSGNLTVIGSLNNGQIVASQTSSDSADKYGAYTTLHYNTAEENFNLISGLSGTTNNQIFIGGGLGEYNAATNILFHTASNNTTTAGTERMRIDSSGNLLVGSTSAPTGVENSIVPLGTNNSGSYPYGGIVGGGILNRGYQITADSGTFTIALTGISLCVCLEVWVNGGFSTLNREGYAVYKVICNRPTTSVTTITVQAPTNVSGGTFTSGFSFSASKPDTNTLNISIVKPSGAIYNVSLNGNTINLSGISASFV